MEEIKEEPTRSTKIRIAIFRLFERRRQYKNHIEILDNTTTKHPKVFSRIYKENLFIISQIEHDLKETINLLKSL